MVVNSYWNQPVTHIVVTVVFARTIGSAIPARYPLAVLVYVTSRYNLLVTQKPHHTLAA